MSWEIAGNYDPQSVEKEVINFWEENKIYQAVKEKANRNSRTFNFIDGPPYPSGDIPHLGTAWNKSLKDAVLRYRRMKGYRVNDRPGYDCHGLPIEVKVEQRLGIRSKKEIEQRIGVDKFVEECKRFALSNSIEMTKWFKELGVFMDWENPYLTLSDEYIESAWWLIKQADLRGLLTSENRVVHWCPRCSTTLAEYEVEYREIEDPSIYVKFPVREEKDTYLIIWTTTPWTLPANVFIMAHPEETYVKVLVGSETWILAEKRLNDVAKECGIINYTIVEKLYGRELVKYTYEHPLSDIIPIQAKLRNYHKVVLSPEYVSMYEGTGLVHAAPGHGFEDYEVAKKHNMQELIICPVDEEGKFTSESGAFAGMNVREANEEIIKALSERKALIHSRKIVHRYPVCWRCKTPVILRATRQWVIKVTSLKDDIKREALRATWIPGWALTRLMNILDNLQDWVISRQRYWGTPLPIWTCPNGHRVVIGSIKELLKYTSIRPRELHKPWVDTISFKCPLCDLEMRRVPDVIDVWLDSGISFYASIGHPESVRKEELVADFIVEGHDQVRGWFFSLLRSGVIGFNRTPYKTVLVHGFMLDEQGREMHKSLGNYVGVDEAIERVGRDPLRLWLLSNTIWEDIKFSWREIEEAKRDLSILWSIVLFAKTYMDIDKYDPAIDPISKYVGALKLEDRWIISKVNSLIGEVDKLMNNYEVSTAVRLLRKFIVEDLSHLYVRLIRPRVWIDENTAEKMSAYAVLIYVIDRLVRLLAPIVPFISEYIYQVLLRKIYKVPSVHLLDYPEPEVEYIDRHLEEQVEVIREVYSAALSARMHAGLKLRQPIRKLIIYSDESRVIQAIVRLGDIIKYLCNAKIVEAQGAGQVKEIIKYRVKPKFRSLGPKYRGLLKQITEYLDLMGDIVARDILEKGVHKATISNVEVELTSSDVEVSPHYVEGYLVENFKYGAVALDTRLTLEELAEGLARDIVRRVQVMRKKLNLPLMARIKTVVVLPPDKRPILDMKRDYIMNETRSVEILLMSEKSELDRILTGSLVEEWDIDDDTYIIAIKPVI